MERQLYSTQAQNTRHKAKDITPPIAWKRDRDTTSGYKANDITPRIAWKRDRDTTSGHNAKDITPPIAWRREAWKEEALEDLPRQGEKGHINQQTRELINLGNTQHKYNKDLSRLP